MHGPFYSSIRGHVNKQDFKMDLAKWFEDSLALISKEANVLISNKKMSTKTRWTGCKVIKDSPG